MALGFSGSQLLVLPAFVVLVAYFERRRRLWSVSPAGAAA
jgi:hypothetical protein